MQWFHSYANQILFAEIVVDTTHAGKMVTMKEGYFDMKRREHWILE